MLRIFRAHTLQRYILREFVFIFALSMAACTALMMVATLYQLANDYESQGITVGRIALLFPFLMPKPLAYAIPSAVLIAATLVFSRMSAEDEVLAAQAGGAPLSVMMAPVVAASVLLSLFCLWNNQWGLSWSNDAIRNQVLKLDDPKSFFEQLNQPGKSVPVSNENGGMARINLLPLMIDPVTKAVRHPIHIAVFKDEQVARTVIADDFTNEIVERTIPPRFKGDRPTVENVLSLTLKGAQILGESPAYFSEVKVDFPQPSLDTIISFGRSTGQKGWLENYRAVETVHATLAARHRFMLARSADVVAGIVASDAGDPAAALIAGNHWSANFISAEAIYATGGAIDQEHGNRVEFLRKLSMSFLPISMAVLGIGLGLLVKKSQRMLGLAIAILVEALVFYPLMLIGKELAMAGKVGLIALWLPNILLFAAGYGLIFAYEHGSLTAIPTFITDFFTKVWRDLGHIFDTVSKPIGAIGNVGSLLFRRKIDGYIAGAFIVPLIVVTVAIVSIFVGMDLVEHAGEVAQGIVKAAEPLYGVPVRTRPQAILDASEYYGICALGWVCDLQPWFILIAGIWCVYALIRNNEHLIMKSAGLPLQRAFRPIVILTILFSLIVTVVREIALPPLIMHRNYLKPMVFHRGREPNALAIYTLDAQGHPVIFEMSAYDSATRTGKDFRVYLINTGSPRIPSIVADVASWDGNAWALQMDPNHASSEKMAKQAKTKISNLPLTDGGHLIEPYAGSTSIADEKEVLEQIKYSKSPLAHWKGIVTPSFLASDQLGAGVMHLEELNIIGLIKPEFLIEFWRRVSEGVMGLVLLWLAVPLLLSEESQGPLAGIGYSILVGGLYWAISLAFNAGASFGLPVWSPVIPHVAFLVIGRWRFYTRMET